MTNTTTTQLIANAILCATLFTALLTALFTAPVAANQHQPIPNRLGVQTHPAEKYSIEKYSIESTYKEVMGRNGQKGEPLHQQPHHQSFAPPPPNKSSLSNITESQQAPTQTPTTQRRAKAKAKVAIIIDDMGFRRHQGIQALALPGDLTYAIIPHSPNAEFLALAAKEQQKEIMLHAPMSNVHNIPLGKNGLTDTMDEAHFKRTLSDSLNSVPHISGVNNHMGSLLTQKALPMEWLMSALGERQLYFIDSRTTSNSVAWSIAQDFNIPSLKRDVFLDHKVTPEFIHKQFQKMMAIAKRKGYAVAIAHPHTETLQYLKKQLHILEQHNIELVTASTLVREYSPNMTSQKQAGNVTGVTKR